MRTLAGKETLPDNGVLLTLASLSRTRSLTLTGSELGTSTATVSRTLAAARAFFGDRLFRAEKLAGDGTDSAHAPATRSRRGAPRLEALSAPAVFDPAGIRADLPDRGRGQHPRLRISGAQGGARAPGLRLEIIGINGDLFATCATAGSIWQSFRSTRFRPKMPRREVLADRPGVLIVQAGIRS